MQKRLWPAVQPRAKLIRNPGTTMRDRKGWRDGSPYDLVTESDSHSRIDSLSHQEKLLEL